MQEVRVYLLDARQAACLSSLHATMTTTLISTLHCHLLCIWCSLDVYLNVALSPCTDDAACTFSLTLHCADDAAPHVVPAEADDAAPHAVPALTLLR
eukprot:1158435-Pelagomonas_calceolata.AAC.3